MQTPTSQLLAASAVSRNGLRSSAVLVDRIAALMQAFEAPPMEEEPKVTQSFRLPPVLVERLEKEAKSLDGAFDRAEGWPPNVLRHSFGSYQAAITRNIPALAIEMGNSEPIIRRHYEEATTQTAAKAYFGLLPS